MIASRCARLLCAVAVAATITAAGMQGVATAQETGYSGEFLREGVVSELVREGLSLVRLGQDLVVERVGDGWRVALVERAGGAVLSERLVAQLPEDERAAIAHMTVMAGAMIREVQLHREERARAQPSAPAAPAAVVPQAPAAQAAPADAALAAAKQRYQKEYIWFEDVYFRSERGNSSWRETHAFRGKYKEPLEGARFYETLGRADLASRYRKRHTTRIGLLGAGGALFLGGCLYPLVDSLMKEDCSESSDFSGCVESHLEVTPLVYAGIMVGAGGLLMAIGFNVDSHPLSPSEARTLADEHNTKLRNELGLPADWEPKRVSEATAPSLRIVPMASTSGGGLVLTGTF